MKPIPRFSTFVRRLITSFSIAFLVVPQVAKANFQFCNQTLDVVNVALGQKVQGIWESSGWWTIGPNQCANLIEETLTARYYYVYAQDVFNQSMVDGTDLLCVSPDEFQVSGEKDCLIRGYITVPFQEVDTRKSERWTVFLQPQEN